MIISIEDGFTYEFRIVGVSHYQQALYRICGGRTHDSQELETTAMIVLDDNNPYDPLSVRVEISGMTVGYLSRDDARTYRKVLKRIGYAKASVECPAMIVGGWDRGDGNVGSFGVRLDLPPLYGTGSRTGWADVSERQRAVSHTPRPTIANRVRNIEPDDDNDEPNRNRRETEGLHRLTNWHVDQTQRVVIAMVGVAGFLFVALMVSRCR